MENPNSYQVGGEHYKTGYEHWDLVLDTHMGYFEGQITRYISRWRQKDGLKDLDKAYHYIYKMIHSFDSGKTLVLTRHLRVRPGDKWLEGRVEHFCRVNNLKHTPEDSIIYLMATWKDRDDLIKVRSYIETLQNMAMRVTQAVAWPPDPVPLEDSNKHAPRAGTGTEE